MLLAASYLGVDLLITVGVLTHTITKRGLRTVQGICICFGSILATFVTSRRVLFHGDAAGSHNARVNARYLPLTNARHISRSWYVPHREQSVLRTRQPVRNVFVVIISQHGVCVCSDHWPNSSVLATLAIRPRGTWCFSTHFFAALFQHLNPLRCY